MKILFFINKKSHSFENSVKNLSKFYKKKFLIVKIKIINDNIHDNDDNECI